MELWCGKWSPQGRRTRKPIEKTFGVREEVEKAGIFIPFAGFRSAHGKDLRNFWSLTPECGVVV